MRFPGSVSLVAVLLLAVPGAFGQQLTNIQTSFEFEEEDGRFIVGQCPGCAVFTNGIATTAPDPQLAVSGTNAWMVPPGSTGAITLEVPARDVTLFLPSGRMLKTLDHPDLTIKKPLVGSPSRKIISALRHHLTWTTAWIEERTWTGISEKNRH